MKSLSLCTMVLLGFTAAAVQAQSLQLAAQPDAHLVRLEQQIEKLALLTADAQAVVLRRHTTQNFEEGVWVNSVRTTYDYDGELQTEILSEVWEADSWENSSRTRTDYSGGLTSETIYETWSGTAWEPQTRIFYAYSGDQISEVRSQTFVNGAWVDEERTTITTSNGVLASSQTDAWDGQNWVPADRYTIEQEGDDVVTVTEEWDGSGWVNADRTVFMGVTVSEFFDMMQELGTEGSAEFGFSFLLRLPDSLQQEWDGTQWVNLSRQVTERDENGRAVLLSLESWEEGEWLSETRYVATYDDQGRLATLNWEMFAEDWTPFLIQTYTYNAAGYLEKILNEVDFGFGLTASSQELFEWSGTAISTERGEMPARISLEPLYPNPFNPQATVRYHLGGPEQALIRIFDAVGRVVATLVDGVQPAGDHTVTFNADGLPSGVYLVRLETPSHSESRTVTLLR